MPRPTDTMTSVMNGFSEIRNQNDERDYRDERIQKELATLHDGMGAFLRTTPPAHETQAKVRCGQRRAIQSVRCPPCLLRARHGSGGKTFPCETPWLMPRAGGAVRTRGVLGRPAGYGLAWRLSVNLVTEFRVSLFEQFLPQSAATSPVNRLVAGIGPLRLGVEGSFILSRCCSGSGSRCRGSAAWRAACPSAHYVARRLGFLLAVGLVHLFLIWNGDILTLYALTGLMAALANATRGPPCSRSRSVSSSLWACCLCRTLAHFRTSPPWPPTCMLRATFTARQPSGGVRFRSTSIADLRSATRQLAAHAGAVSAGRLRVSSRLGVLLLEAVGCSRCSRHADYSPAQSCRSRRRGTCRAFATSDRVGRRFCSPCLRALVRWRSTVRGVRACSPRLRQSDSWRSLIT